MRTAEQEVYWWQEAWERGDLTEEDLMRILSEIARGTASGLWSSTFGMYKMLLPSTYADMARGMRQVYSDPRGVARVLAHEFKKAPIESVANVFASWYLGPALISKAKGLAVEQLSKAVNKSAAVVEAADKTATSASTAAESAKKVSQAANTAVEKAAANSGQLAAKAEAATAQFNNAVAAASEKTQEISGALAKCEAAGEALGGVASLHPDKFNAAQVTEKLGAARTLLDSADALSPTAADALKKAEGWGKKAAKIAWHNTNKAGKKSGRVAALAAEAKKAAEAAEQARQKFAQALKAVPAPKMPLAEKAAALAASQSAQDAASAASKAAEIAAEAAKESAKAAEKLSGAMGNLNTATTLLEKQTQIANKVSSVVKGVSVAGSTTAAVNQMGGYSSSRGESAAVSSESVAPNEDETSTQTDPNEGVNQDEASTQTDSSADSVSEVNQLRATVSELLSRLKEQADELRELNQRVHFSEDTLDELNRAWAAKYEKVLNDSSELKRDHDALQGALNETETDLSTLLEKHVELQEREVELTQELEELRSQSTMNCDSNDQPHTVLQQQLVNLRTRLGRMQQEKDDLIEGIQCLLQERDQALTKVRHLGVKLDRVMHENKELNDDVKFAEQELERTASYRSSHTPSPSSAAASASTSGLWSKPGDDTEDNGRDEVDTPSNG